MTAKPAKTVCGAHNRAGLPCKRPAGWGTDHAGFGLCKLHMGSTPAQMRNAEKKRALWQQTLLNEMDPSLSVIRQLRDGEDVSPRDRIKAASWLVEQARTLTEGVQGGLTVNIAIIPEWLLVLKALEQYPEARMAVLRSLKMP